MPGYIIQIAAIRLIPFHSATRIGFEHIGLPVVTSGFPRPAGEDKAAVGSLVDTQSSGLPNDSIVVSPKDFRLRQCKEMGGKHKTQNAGDGEAHHKSTPGGLL